MDKSIIVVPTPCIAAIKLRGSLDVAKWNPEGNGMAYPGFRFATSMSDLNLIGSDALCMGMQFVTLIHHGTHERPSMNPHAKHGEYHSI